MKKLIVAILTVVFSLTLTLGVVGCGGDDSGSACKHKPKAGAIYTSVDNDYHRYTCSLCKEKVNEKHAWSEGVADGNGDPTYKCDKCGVQKAR